MLYSFEDLHATFGSNLLNEAGRSEKYAYRTSIRVEDPVLGPVPIRGACSCSQRGKCEHVVAVLLQALGYRQEMTDADLDLLFEPLG